MKRVFGGYQGFGGVGYKDARCGRAKAELKDFQNMLCNKGNFFVMHFWRENNKTDDHCIAVYERDSELNIAFYAHWLGGHINVYVVPIDHQIEIGGGPNHELGSREYNSFRWYIHDKTTNEYIEEVKDTPATWTFRAVDVALEMKEGTVPNGLRKAMTKLVALDENLEPVHLPPIFWFGDKVNPDGCNCHEEIYSHDGYEVECWQWTTLAIDEFLYWFRIPSKNIMLYHVMVIVQAYKGEKDIGFKPTLDNLIDVVRCYRNKP